METTFPTLDPEAPDAGAETPAAGQLRLAPPEHDWLLLMAYLYLEQHRPEDARIILRVLHRNDPADPRILRCLALAELSAGDAVAAARAASRAMQAEESALHRIPLGLIFARSLWNQGKHEAARDYTANLLEKDSPEH